MHVFCGFSHREQVWTAEGERGSQTQRGKPTHSNSSWTDESINAELVLKSKTEIFD